MNKNKIFISHAIVEKKPFFDDSNNEMGNVYFTVFRITLTDENFNIKKNIVFQLGAIAGKNEGIEASETDLDKFFDATFIIDDIPRECIFALTFKGYSFLRHFIKLCFGFNYNSDDDYKFINTFAYNDFDIEHHLKKLLNSEHKGIAALSKKIPEKIDKICKTPFEYSKIGGAEITKVYNNFLINYYKNKINTEQ